MITSNYFREGLGHLFYIKLSHIFRLSSVFPVFEMYLHCTIVIWYFDHLTDLLYHDGHCDLCESGRLQCVVLHLSGNTAAAESTKECPGLAHLHHHPDRTVTCPVHSLPRLPSRGLYRYLYTYSNSEKLDSLLWRERERFKILFFIFEIFIISFLLQNTLGNSPQRQEKT